MYEYFVKRFSVYVFALFRFHPDFLQYIIDGLVYELNTTIVIMQTSMAGI